MTRDLIFVTDGLDLLITGCVFVFVAYLTKHNLIDRFTGTWLVIIATLITVKVIIFTTLSTRML